MKLEGSSILVTGAGGFIGSHIVRALREQGARVLPWVRPGSNPWRLADIEGIRTQEVDLRDGAQICRSLERDAPTAVVHAAKAPSTGVDADPEEAELINVRSTEHLLEWASVQGVEAFLHLGSSAEYIPSTHPLDERAPLGPTSIHGRTKARASTHVLEASSRGLPGTVLRIFSVFGPWDRENRFLPSAIRAALSGERLDLTRRGLKREWIYVSDVVDLCLRGLQQAPLGGEVFNAGTGVMLANEEVVAVLESVLGKPIYVQEGALPDRPWDRSFWAADATLARTRLGWSPQWSFRKGLERLLVLEGYFRKLHV